jgi:hypothetical protein
MVKNIPNGQKYPKWSKISQMPLKYSKWP